MIRVTDTGIGLDPRNLDKIFTRFYRGRENHTAGTAGVGIGLDLCRRLTELHHGTISGRNRTDGIRGSEFTVTIPVSESAYAPPNFSANMTMKRRQQAMQAFATTATL